MSKLRKLLVMLVFVLFLFCTYNQALAGEKISFWMFPLQDTREEIQPILDSFEAETGIEVDFTLIPWGSGNQKILAAMAAGNPPDVMYTTMSRVLPLAEFGNALQPLDKYLDEAYKEDVFADPSTLNNYKKDGKIYAVPFLGGIHTWKININSFKEAGLEYAIDKMTGPDQEWTWDDLIKWSRKLTRDSDGDGNIDTYGFIYPGGSSSVSPFFRLYWNIGGKVLSPEGEVLLGGEKTVKTLTLLKNLVDNEVMPIGAENITPSEVDNLFVEGKVGISVGPSGAILNYGKNGGDTSKFLTVYPPKSYNGPRGNFMAWDALAVSANADGDKAWKLVDHLLRSKRWSKYLLGLGLFPVGGAEPELVDSEFYQETLEVTNNLLTMDKYAYNRHEILHPKSSQINRVINKEVQAVLYGAKTPEKAAADMCSGIKKILSD